MEDDCTRLFLDGKGCVLTFDVFVEEVATVDAKKHGKSMNKETQAAQRAGREAAKDEIEARWREMKAKHEERVQEWVAECKRLKGEGVVYPKSQHGQHVCILRRVCQ